MMLFDPLTDDVTKGAFYVKKGEG